MRARPAAAACAAAALVPATLAGCGSGDRGGPPENAARTAAPAPGRTAATTGATPALTAAPAARRPALEPPLGFHLRRRAQLRLGPSGKVVTTLRPRTEFGSPRIYAVANRVPGWVLVRTAVRGHHVGWLPTSAGVLFSEPRSIVIDLSERRLTVFHRGRPAGVYRVAVGAPGTPTPVGKFGVTDRLRIPRGTPYGCCVLALTGRQERIPQGWGGGDRIAIHATPQTGSIGNAVSHGCLRASDGVLRRLMRRIRLGTQVTIHR